MSRTFINVMDSDKNWSKNLTKKKSSSNEVPRGYGKKSIEERWKVLNKNTKYTEYLKELEKKGIKQPEGYRSAMEELLDNDTMERCDIFKDNIENFIGTVKVPVGIAGPVKVNGLHAQGDYFVPLATTEAALVASINRGINCINQAGGATAAVVLEGISRDPVFYFKDIIDAGTFLQWANKNFDNFKEAAEKTTRHGKLYKVKYTLEANVIHMKCQYTVGDASGQNIITLASEAVLAYIEKNTPVKPKKYYLEGGMSGDKKANSYHMVSVRGKRVIAEVLLPKSVVWSTLHCLTEEMHYSSSIGSRGLHMLGSIGINSHFANPITAMSIALGQDPACTSESHIGIARTDLIDGDLHVAVTLPNILVATVGGGTKLPSQRACLEIMGLLGNNKANELAEVMAVVCIAGEISLGAAIISGDFAKAHKILARDTSKPIDMEKDTLEEAFEKAQALLVKLSSPPSKEVILNVYGLYKQATVGNVNVDKPSLFSLDLKAKAKYEAWKKKKGIKKEDAMKQYIELILNCVKEEKKKTEEEKIKSIENKTN